MPDPESESVKASLSLYPPIFLEEIESLNMQ